MQLHEIFKNHYDKKGTQLLKKTNYSLFDENGDPVPSGSGIQNQADLNINWHSNSEAEDDPEPIIHNKTPPLINSGIADEIEKTILNVANNDSDDSLLNFVDEVFNISTTTDLNY